MSGKVEGTPAQGLSARVGRVLWEGLLAGFFAAVLVAAAYLAFDFFRGAPLRTPIVLGALFLEGAEDAPAALASSQLLFRFTVLHVVLWLGTGIFSSCLANIGEIFPRLWPLVFALSVFLLSSTLYLAGALSMPGLPSFHLWLGILLGSAAVLLLLTRRHPSAIRQFDGITVTQTARHDLEKALAAESQDHLIPEVRNCLADEQALQA